MNKKQGYVMAGSGLFLIIMNALSYIFGWEKEFTPLGIIGIVFVILGMNAVRENK